MCEHFKVLPAYDSLLAKLIVHVDTEDFAVLVAEARRDSFEERFLGAVMVRDETLGAANLSGHAVDAPVLEPFPDEYSRGAGDDLVFQRVVRINVTL